MNVHYLQGGFTNSKSIWPTSAAYKIQGASLHHQLFNTDYPAGTGYSYCRS